MGWLGEEPGLMRCASIGQNAIVLGFCNGMVATPNPAMPPQLISPLHRRGADPVPVTNLASVNDL
jgi:hypothetical protein